MYDDEEEIKRKRRKLIIAIVVIVVLIILLLIFIFSRTGNKKPTTKELACELEVKSGTKGKDGIYTTAVEVGFKSITAVSKDIQIVQNTVGTSDNARNKETYTVSKKGTVKVYGYVKDAAGNKGTCSIEVKVNPSKPTCNLEVKSGTLGENGWYKSNVVVNMKEMNSNNEDTQITKYYITKKTTKLEDGTVVKPAVPNESISEFTVVDDAVNEIVGYVIDSNGNEGTCNITIKKDSTPPTCTLKVVDGSPNASGIYTGNSVVGLAEAKDATTQVVSKGVGTTKNYKNETYAVTGYGAQTIYGYVKDEAGNEGSCSISIRKPDQPVAPPKESYPSCTLKIISGKSNNGQYLGKTVVGFASKNTTNNAKIVSFGIANSPSINGKETIELSTSGVHNVVGMVKDSYGHTSTCLMEVHVVIEDNLLAKKVKVGDMVAYNAGNWDDDLIKPTANGTFGGYKQGNSKNASVACRDGDNAGSGWKVLSISGNKVTIVHAGIPECYYHDSFKSNANAVSTLDQRASVYKNTFAESARMLKETDVANLAQDHAFRKINAYYYLSTASGTNELKFVTTSGRLTQGGANAQGVRPVITLREDVRTTGQSNGAWTLTFDASKDSNDMVLPSTTGELGDMFDFVKDVVNNDK